MKAKKLAEILMMCPEAEVEAFDPNMEDWQPVTGVLNDANEQSLRLYTDAD